MFYPEIFLFNFFSLFALVSGLFVILSSNAVYSVLFLILTFCNIIFLLLLMGAEFFAFLLLIVYVGAIAVLFLFVVMMLNIKITKKRNDFSFFSIIFINLFLLIIIFYKLTTFFDLFKTLPINLLDSNWINWIYEINVLNNIEVIGNVFYSNYSLLFLISSVILLIAMIGVIVLTVHKKSNKLTKKQQINNQINRSSKKAVKFILIKSKV